MSDTTDKEPRMVTIRCIDSMYGTIDLPFPVEVDMSKTDRLHGDGKVWAILENIAKAAKEKIDSIRERMCDEYCWFPKVPGVYPARDVICGTCPLNELEARVCRRNR